LYDLGADIGPVAEFTQSQIAVAHHDNAVAIQRKYPVYDIEFVLGFSVFDESKNNVTTSQICRFFQDDAIAASDNERQHASTVDRERDAYTF
jgi:hypothetical protein